jgi:Polyketide cyclase / dehydrase and lipid transport
MRTLVRIAVTFVVAVVVIGIVAYADGSILPVQHSASVSGVVDAPPAKVFALITDIAAAPTWRHEVQSVQVLPLDNGRDHWIENLGHGQTMNFLAVGTEPVSAAGVGRREVRLDDPGASYGGTWTYEISPGPTANQTSLRITEAGFIKPPMYRFVMVHIFGMTRNLDQYMSDLKAATGKS